MSAATKSTGPEELRRACSKCRLDLPRSSFHNHRNGKDGLRSRCKDCNREEARDFYKRNPRPYKYRARLFNTEQTRRRLEVMGELRRRVGCQLCGEREECVLDFHHLVGNSKGREGGMPVSRAAGHSNIRFLRELAACIVVCVNCHRKAHAGVISIPVDLPRANTFLPDVGDDGQIHG